MRRPESGFHVGSTGHGAVALVKLDGERTNTDLLDCQALDDEGQKSPLLFGTEAVGDPITVLPVLFHLLWRHDLEADLSVPLHPFATATTTVTGQVGA